MTALEIFHDIQDWVEKQKKSPSFSDRKSACNETLFEIIWSPWNKNYIRHDDLVVSPAAHCKWRLYLFERR